MSTDQQTAPTKKATLGLSETTFSAILVGLRELPYRIAAPALEEIIAVSEAASEADGKKADRKAKAPAG